MTISERVFALFDKNKNKKQADLARVLGVRQNTITNWKQGKSNPPAEHLELIADFFGVSIEYLVSGKDPCPRSVINHGVYDCKNNYLTVTFNGVSSERELSELETEILRVCSQLDVKRKNALLTYAYKLEEQ